MSDVKQLVQATDYLLGDAAERAAPVGDTVYPPNREGLVLRIFGTLPDYRRPDIQALWRETGQMDPLDAYEYCRRQGVEVLDASGTPVPPWRDITVLLLARDRGLLE